MLVSGAGDTNNASFNISGDKLRTGALLSAGVYSVRVQVPADRLDELQAEVAGLPYTLDAAPFVQPGPRKASPSPGSQRRQKPRDTGINNGGLSSNP